MSAASSGRQRTLSLRLPLAPLYQFPQTKRKSQGFVLGTREDSWSSHSPLLHPIHSLLTSVFEIAFKTAAETQLIVTD